MDNTEQTKITDEQITDLDVPETLPEDTGGSESDPTQNPSGETQTDPIEDSGASEDYKDLEEPITPEPLDPLPEEPEEPIPEETETEKKLKIISMNIRERDCPFFEDDELNYYLEKNGGDVKATSYECLILKSMDTTLSVSGLSCADTSKYFLRLASMYAPCNSGIIEGV